MEILYLSLLGWTSRCENLVQTTISAYKIRNLGQFDFGIIECFSRILEMHADMEFLWSPAFVYIDTAHYNRKDDREENNRSENTTNRAGTFLATDAWRKLRFSGTICL